MLQYVSAVILRLGGSTRRDMAKKLPARPIKRSRPPGAGKGRTGRKTAGPGSKQTAMRNRRPSSALMWLSGKIVTTILPALVCGIGLGIAIGYWLDPGDQQPTAKAILKGTEQARTVAVPAKPDLTVPLRVVRQPPPPAQIEAPKAVEEAPQSSQPDAAATAFEEPAETAPVEKRQQWLANAVAAPAADGRPAIALVIDDVGVDLKRSRRAVALEAPLTIAIMTYANDVTALAATARENGHELIVHVPMEPVDLGSNTGPNALLTSLDDNELMRRLNWGLTRFDGYVGISNHMGSRFTAWEPGMRRVLGEIHERGLLYLDSRTTADSASTPLAHALGLPHATRDVFLDNDPTPEAVRRQLDELEQIAKRRGYAIGIGHPREATIEVLSDWLREVKKRGFVLVPISAIVRRQLAKT